MRRAGIIFLLLIPVAAAAGMLYLNLPVYIPAGILALALIICSVQLYTLQKTVRDFIVRMTGSSSGQDLLEAVEYKYQHLQENTHRLIDALDKIGEDDQQAFDDSKLDGEAGEAIRRLKKKLASLKVEEKRRVWAAQGIASINEIRENNANLTEYGYKLVRHLIKYLEANQGAFYTLQDEVQPPHLELLCTYAYGRRKFSNEKVIIEIGNGIVGQSVLERQISMLTDIPADYIHITSGLGDAPPGCLVVIPLVYRDEVFGVIELASFKKFEKHQLEFITRASEVIALELSNLRSQERTRKLLEESQEEELRQSLLDMKAAQLEMVRKEEELSHQLVATQKAMNMAEQERKKNEAILEGCMDAVISFNQQGYIGYMNRAAEEMFGYARHEVLGKSVIDILKIKIQEEDDDKFVIRTSTGNEVSVRTEIYTTDSKGDELSLLLTATSVKLDREYLFTLFAQKVSVDLF
ncbi:MAG TPA: PAS domain S-box protein [Ohtaekwangia sp.]|uniref:PAS domain S-box protein n=1 Tax=Ohtaekwangia sp. TaxID=2066019 RepID=UPI002F936D3E